MAAYQFSKYSGCGNDFLLFDNRSKQFPTENKLLIQKICHRRLGVGADGIILLENSAFAHAKMRIFNADGGEAEMCGNGVRCLAKFMRELNFSGEKYLIETMLDQVSTSFQDDQVSVSIPSPTDTLSLELPVNNENWQWYYLDTGVPHIVSFVKNVQYYDLKSMAPPIRFHPRFTPKGTNVNLAALNSEGKIDIRTYERGVEGETLACGTGALAVGIVAAQLYQLKSPVYLIPKSQEMLRIDFKESSKGFENITLTGPAHHLFTGKLTLDVL